MAKKQKQQGSEPKVDPKDIRADEKDLHQKRDDISKFYSENIPHLETQLKYEELLRDIEKTRAERLQAQMFIAQTMAAPPEGEESQAAKDFNAAKIQQQAAKMKAQDGAASVQQMKRTLKRQD